MPVYELVSYDRYGNPVYKPHGNKGVGWDKAKENG